MRTTPEENARLGKILAEKAERGEGPVRSSFPLRGVSMLDSVTDEGPQHFWWPEADKALFDAIKANVPCRTSRSTSWTPTSTTPAFAEPTSRALLEMLKR